MSDTPESGDWYCQNCGYLSSSRVTNSETCDTCHNPVQWHPAEPQDSVVISRECKAALTTKQDGVAISSWAATEATEALKVVQADRYHMCAEYGEALSEILAALQQLEQSDE